MNKKTETPVEDQNPIVAVNFQYIKDLSFENPHSPLVLSKIKTPLAINVNIDIKAAKLEAERFEVILLLQAKATGEEKTIYLVELAYAGVTTLKNVAEQNIDRALMIYVPSLLFPFARSILGNLTREAGLPPLMLDPIDFTSVYNQKKKMAEEAATKKA